MNSFPHLTRLVRFVSGSGQKQSGALFGRALIPMLFAQQHQSNSTMNVAKGLTLTPSKHDTSKRQIVVLLSWLMAKKKHLEKYNSFYNKQGFDVLCVEINPGQLLWPKTGTQIVAQDVLSFLEQQQSYKHILIHGFSVGAYLYGEVLVKMKADLDKYRPISDKIVGQIFDSAVDFDGIETGFPAAVTKSKIAQKCMETYLRTHMKFFYEKATKHYLASSKAFHYNFVVTPSLFLFSKSDPVGTAEGNLRVIRKWELNAPVYAKCWDSSPHVSHYHHYPDEYLEELSAYLEKLGLLVQPHRRVSKL